MVMDENSQFGHKVRSGERYEVRCEARIEPLDEHLQLETPDSVSVYDIARSGVMLHSNQPLQRGSAWRLRLLDGGCAIASLPVIVRYCREENGVFRVGMQLVFEPAVLMHLGVHINEETDEELAGDDDAFDISFQVAFESP
jgi:hypothetical protein